LISFFYQAMSSTQNLMTVEGDSPRLVLFTMEGGIAAYIVADEIKMKIFQPSVCKSVACLLASYYVWDTKYPNTFNVEYFRDVFALIFMAVYGIIVFFRYLVVVFLIILKRAVLPRMRYDKLIYLC
ncbi:NU1M oxidoreductase, partial [Acromyrmex heyeri]